MEDEKRWVRDGYVREPWMLNRFRFAAQTVAIWREGYGDEVAARMISKAVLDGEEGYSRETRLAFLTAWGL